MALAQIDSDGTTTNSMAHVSLMPWVMTKKDCERLTLQSKAEVRNFYERVLEQNNATQGKTVEAFERLLKEKELHHDRLLKGKEGHVADLQKDMEGLRFFGLVLCAIFALVKVVLAILYSYAMKARNDQVRKLDARVNKCEGIIQEKEKRILELLQQLNNPQQQQHPNYRGSTSSSTHNITPQHM